MEIAERASNPTAHVQRPRFSPDGTKLSWEVNDHRAKRVALFVGGALEGAEPVRPPARRRSSLTAGFDTVSREALAHELAWSPASIGTYAYSATGSDEDYDLYVGTARVASGPGADGGATWSADGRWLVFSSARTGEGDLYALELAHIEAPPVRLTDTPGSSELHATTSSRGALAWVAHGRTGDHIWVSPGVGEPARQVTHAKGSQLRPRFSPDGSRIAYYANTPGSEHFGLFVQDLEGGAPRQLLDAVYVDGNGPTWVDDVALLAVRDDDARFDPVVRVTVGGVAATLPLPTVGNGDLAAIRTETGVRLAWCAQGRVDGVQRDFRRLYVAELSLQ